MFGLTLIAVLAIMGGIIAYIGDWLGSKVGKRKLTVFGLRPKHTSILFTIVTGIVIAGVTLGVLSVASRDVRTALFGMEALKAELTGLSREVAAKSVELDASRSALEAKNKEYSVLTVKINETMDRLASVTEQLATVNAERDRTAAALDLAKGDLTKAQQEIDALQATKSELDARVASLNEAKTALQSDVDRLNELTANLRQGIQTVREGVVVFRASEVLTTAVTKGGQPLKDTEEILGGIINATNRAVLNRLGVQDKNIEVLWIAKADFDQAAKIIASTQEEVIVRILAMGNTIYGEPVIGRIELFPNRLIYSAGQTIYSETADAGDSAKQAEDVVLLFLQKVNAQAIAKGILPDPLQGTVGVISGSQLFETVNKVKRIGGRVVLTATTKGDIHTSGPLQIEINVRAASD
ncbi:DUF3084 domain-containing protein [Anaeroselena agilis]|uniref:DUF3084 domain-containing protein n=1 Tax=Anaeroselena agilis TaxID=3063788 RepID=A0ABU3P449_9FIRM|nr:DUF3084 domain-containing protein [Selenomonadales bacterium 4137-cl]